MTKPFARIENWMFIGGRLQGNITYHNRQDEFPKDIRQITSEVINIDYCIGYAETQNTYYILGERARKGINEY